MSAFTSLPERADLHACLHTLSQPLTVVGLALAMVESAATQAERESALEAALSGCHRAMESVRHMRCILDGASVCDLPAANSLENELSKQWASECAA